MAVLIEVLSVVLLCEKIINSYQGGIEAFEAELPNSTLRADGYLASLTFMAPEDVCVYVNYLESKGLAYRNSDEALDLVVVDQFEGFCVPCRWAIFGQTDWNNDSEKPVSVCAKNFNEVQKVITYDGWVFEGSLSAQAEIIKGDVMPDNLQLIGQEDGVDIYQDIKTGDKFYSSRSIPPSQ